jgi:hypothetical protein
VLPFPPTAYWPGSDHNPMTSGYISHCDNRTEICSKPKRIQWSTLNEIWDFHVGDYKNTDFWYMMPCILVEIYLHVTGTSLSSWCGWRLFLCFMNHKARKECRRVKVYVYYRFCIQWRWLSSFTLQSLWSRDNTPHYPMNRRPREPRGRLIFWRLETSPALATKRNVINVIAWSFSI